MRFLTLLLSTLTVLLVSAVSAQATTILFGGPDDPSLHGATGSLAITDNGSDFTVVWSIDFTGFDDAAAVATGHEYLTHVAFKAFAKVDSVVLNDPAIGTLFYPSNVNSGSDGCDENGSSAKFVCVALTSPVLATADGTFSVAFTVVGKLMGDPDLSWSYRGKYGYDEGWVISETGGEIAVPEPSAALVFAFGALVVGVRLRR